MGLEIENIKHVRWMMNYRKWEKRIEMLILKKII
jgi:hypothetical protein